MVSGAGYDELSAIFLPLKRSKPVLLRLRIFAKILEDCMELNLADTEKNKNAPPFLVKGR